MAETFDPYVEWLGLRPAARPLSYYQLLSLDDFEDDTQRIVAAADGALARVRSVRPGAQRAAWQQLLDELLLAKMCLLDPARKAQFDSQLLTQQNNPATAPAADNPPAPSPQAAVDLDMFPPGMGQPPTHAAQQASMPPPVAAELPCVPPSYTAPPPYGAPPLSHAAPPSYVAPPAYGAPAALAPPVAFGAPPGYPPSSSYAPPAYAVPPETRFPNPAPPAYAMPPSAPPLQSAAPPAYIAPPNTADVPPLAPSYSTAAGPAPASPQPTGWTGWKMPATAAPAPGQPVRFVAPAPVASVGSSPATAPIPGAVTPTVPVEQAQPSRPVAATAAAPSGSAESNQAVRQTPVQATPLQSVRQAFPKPVPAAQRPSVPMPVFPTIEPVTVKRAAQPQSQLGLAIGAGVLALVAVAVIILKPPGGSEDVQKSTPMVATATRDNDNAFRGETHTSSGDSDAERTPPEEPSPPRRAAPESADNRTGRQPRPERKPSPKPVPKPEIVTAPPRTGKQPGPPQPPATEPGMNEPFRKALTQARGALAARDVEAAKQKLAATAPLAKSDDDQADLARMNLLAAYVEGFWNGVRGGMKSLQLTDEITLNGMVAAVVDSDSNSLTLHTPGKNHEFTVKTMPAELAMTLALRWFDQSPGSKMSLGAFQAVDPRGNKDEARRLWQQGSAADAAELLPLINAVGGAVDPSGPAGDAAALPNEKMHALALKQVKSTFQSEYKGAKTPELKVELGRKLSNVAGETDNPTDRYTLLREALDLAAAGGNPQLIVEAADELARHFAVDPLELKAEALARAAQTTNATAAAKEIARAALGLLDEAVNNKHSKAAGKLGQAAVQGARKSKDAELIKAANERNQQVQAAK